ncbi:MAG: RNase adapter RapZ [Halothiobacillaceae bacterium]
MTMHLVLISGHSGSGKSVALGALEDGGYYCVDNLPASLLESLIDTYRDGLQARTAGLAVGIDARAPRADLQALPRRLARLVAERPGLVVRRIFLEAATDTLIARFSETRRKHPLTEGATSLAGAVEAETRLLAGVRADADLVIDTSITNVHQLRELIRQRVLEHDRRHPSILLQSFGFKRGIPLDTDFLFDVRHLPNPHWDPSLRAQDGRDAPVARFLESQAPTGEALDDIFRYLRGTLWRFAESDRSYLTISIGCTGGRHRSVYLVERLYRQLAPEVPQLHKRHRDLP